MRLTMTLALMLAAAPALAERPIPIPDAQQYARIGALAPGCNVADVNDSSTSVVTVSTADSSTCWLPWDSIVTVTSSLAATCCLSMTADTTLGDGETAAAKTLTDANGPNGQGACRLFAAGVPYPFLVSKGVLTRSIGARRGVCSAAVTGPGGFMFPPCRVDGDCPSGTCDTTPTALELSKSGGLLVCRSVDSNPNQISVDLER